MVEAATTVVVVVQVQDNPDKAGRTKEKGGEKEIIFQTSRFTASSFFLLLLLEGGKSNCRDNLGRGSGWA